MKSIFAVIIVLFVSLFSQPLMAVENASWGAVKSVVADDSSALAEKLVVSATKAGGSRNRQNKQSSNKIFNAVPVFEALPNEGYNSNTNGTTTVFMFKVSVPPSMHNEWVELNSFVFKVMGEGVYPRSLQLYAFDDPGMTVMANPDYNPYIPVKTYNLTGGFLLVVEPDPAGSPPLSVTVPPGRTRYFILFADIVRFSAADNLEVSLSEVNFQVIRRGQ